MNEERPQEVRKRPLRFLEIHEGLLSRVENLLAQMTLEEKLAQTYCYRLYDDMMDESGNLVFEEDIRLRGTIVIH
jgi:hypothetical protein